MGGTGPERGQDSLDNGAGVAVARQAQHQGGHGGNEHRRQQYNFDFGGKEMSHGCASQSSGANSSRICPNGHRGSPTTLK